jgi:hypothetical protein
MLKQAIAKKILFLIALHGAGMFDAITTQVYLHKRPYLPGTGVIYQGQSGLFYTSVGGATHELNPLLGPHPSEPRVLFQINADALLPEVMLLKHRRGGREVAAGVIAEHTVLGIKNLVTMPSGVPAGAVPIGSGAMAASTTRDRPKR